MFLPIGLGFATGGKPAELPSELEARVVRKEAVGGCVIKAGEVASLVVCLVGTKPEGRVADFLILDDEGVRAIIASAGRGVAGISSSSSRARFFSTLGTSSRGGDGGGGVIRTSFMSFEEDGVIWTLVSSDNAGDGASERLMMGRDDWGGRRRPRGFGLLLTGRGGGWERLVKAESGRRESDRLVTRAEASGAEGLEVLSLSPKSIPVWAVKTGGDSSTAVDCASSFRFVFS